MSFGCAAVMDVEQRFVPAGCVGAHVVVVGLVSELREYWWAAG